MNHSCKFSSQAFCYRQTSRASGQPSESLASVLGMHRLNPWSLRGDGSIGCDPGSIPGRVVFSFPHWNKGKCTRAGLFLNCATPRTAQFFMLRGPCTGSLEKWAHFWKYLKKLGVQSFKTSLGSKRNFVTAPRTSHLISNVKRIKCTFFLFSGHVLGVAIVAQFSLVCYFRFRRKRKTLGFIWA